MRGAVTAWWPRALRRAVSPELRERLSEAGRCATELARERYNAIDILAMFTASLLAVNKAERSGSFALSSDSYNNLGFITGTIGLKRLTQRLFTRAREGNGRALCNQHFARALISLGTGDLADSTRELTTGLEHAKTLGDRYCIVTGISISGTVLELDGRFTEAMEQREEMLDLARANGNSRHECWASTGLAAALSVMDRHEEAQAWTRYSRARLPGDDLLTGIGCHAAWAVIRLRAGDAVGAREDGERALALWEQSRLNMLPHLGALTDASTVYLTLWEEALARGSAEAEALGRAVRNLSRRLDSYAGQFRVGRSRAARIRGSLLWLSGKHGAARKAWTQALEQARRLSMTADEAHALLELARHEPEGTEGRRQKLEQAHEFFTRLGMVYDVRVTQVLLGTPLVAAPALVSGEVTAA
jgi:tetratricopeptide (TPR) repeat protein